MLFRSFKHNIFGQNNTNLFVSTNSWISFENYYALTLASFSATVPAWPNIQIGAGQTSCQRVYWTTTGSAPNRTFNIRFEGTNATTGTLGSPNMVWELILYENTPNQFDIQIGTWTPPATNYNGISNGNRYFGSFTPAANTGWRFVTSAVSSGWGSKISLAKYNKKGDPDTLKSFNGYANGSDAQAITILGNKGNSEGKCIKVAPNGAVYVLYTSSALANTLGTPTTSGSLKDIGICRLNVGGYYTNNSGIVAFNKTYGTVLSDTAQTFDIDSSNNLYVVGFSNTLYSTNTDIVVFKLNENGVTLWKKNYYAGTSVTRSSIPTSIRWSSAGYVYIWGHSNFSPSTATVYDFFLIKINASTSSVVWNISFSASAPSNTSTTFENSLDVDSSDNVYVAGYSTATGGQGNAEIGRAHV